MVAIILIASVTSYGQSITVQSSAGFTTIMDNKYDRGWNLTSFLGFEINDRIGFEYGYSWSLNNDPTTLNSFLNGSTSSYTVGDFTHLGTIYWKTKRDENTGLNLGVGFSSTNVYKTSKIENYTKPHIKLGVDHKLSKEWGVNINTIVGGVMGITFGVSKVL